MNKKKLYSSLILLALLFAGFLGKDFILSETPSCEAPKVETVTQTSYEFRNEEFLQEHFEKHGDEFDYATAEEYQEGASRVINDSDSLHKLEKEDGDDVYYLESTNEFVIVSKDGYIRTYFKPSDGREYFDRQ